MLACLHMAWPLPLFQLFFFIQRKDHLRGHLAISAVIRTTRATELGQIRNAGLASRFRFRERLVP